MSRWQRSRLRTWWSQPDRYDWMTSLLRTRGLLRSARMVMAAVAGSAALVPLTILASRPRPSIGEVVLGAVASMFTLGAAVFWLIRWPNRVQSVVATLFGAGFVTWWVLTQPTAGLAALGCTATAVTGGYIAVFHNPRLLVFNTVVAVCAAAAAARGLAHDVGLAAAVGAFWIICFLNVSVPLAAWVMSHAIGVYAQRSEEDALTGLLNRRAFIEVVSRRLLTSASDTGHLTVVMVDLDDFKSINDTHGHFIGNCTLQAVAALLRTYSPEEAAICRAGGEEFLIALASNGSDLAPLSSQFCSAIAELEPAVTASIGTATSKLDALRGNGQIEALISIADDAMYAAKRGGGNRVCHGASR